MRNRYAISTGVTAVLFLSSAVLAYAQAPPVPSAPSESADDTASQTQADPNQQESETGPAGDLPQPSEQTPDAQTPDAQRPDVSNPRNDTPARRSDERVPGTGRAPNTPPPPGQETDRQPGAAEQTPRSTFRQEGRAAAEASATQRMGFDVENRQDGHLIVSSVSRDSLAARAGLRGGDIIVSADGRRFSSHRDFHGFLDRREGRRVSIVVFRDGAMRTLTIAPTAARRESFYRGPAGAQGPPPVGYYNGGRYRGTTWYHGTDPYWCHRTYYRPGVVYDGGVTYGYRGYRYYDDDDYDDFYDDDDYYEDYEIEIERDGDIDIDD